MSEEKILKDQAEKLRAIIKKDAKKTVKECKANIITVTSGKGGVGKSNVAVNRALELINKGKRVLIIDADLGLANVEILMGMIPKYNLKEVIDGEKTISEMNLNNLEISFISSSIPLPVYLTKASFFVHNWINAWPEFAELLIIADSAADMVGSINCSSYLSKDSISTPTGSGERTRAIPWLQWLKLKCSWGLCCGNVV